MVGTMCINNNPMIQIPPETTPAPSPPLSVKEALPANPYILRRMIYTVILASLLLLMSFYFDLLEDYDLVSMVLGFLVCIILQFTLLSYFLAEDMEALQMDEFGVIKDKIKTLFGELNPAELDRKLRQKYYRREASEEDKLFSEANDRIYQNVMTHLRSKEEPNFNELISKVKGKWLSLEHKIKLIEEFLLGMLKIEEGRKLVYQKHKNRIKRLAESEEHQDWRQFLNEQVDEPQTKYESFYHHALYSQEELALLDPKEEHSVDGATSIDEPLAITNWGILNNYMLDKTRLVEKEAADLKERVVQEFQSYASTMRSESASNAKKREKLYEDFRQSREQKNRNLQQLQKTACKIMELSGSLPANQVEGGEIEQILKKEFELRLLKIESENLLIKVSKTTSSTLSFADQLYGYLEEENRNLDHYLDVFKRKINQYMHEMVGYGEKRAPSTKKHLEEAAPTSPPPEPMRADMDPELLYTKVMARKSREGSFRGHLDQLVREFEELKEELAKARSIIREFKNDFQKKQSMDVIKGVQNRVGANTGARVFYFASSVNDEKLTRTFEELVALEEKHSQNMKAVLQKQLNLVRQFEKEKGGQFGSDIKHLYEQFKRKEEESRKAKRRLSKEQKSEKEPSEDAFMAECQNSRVSLVNMILDYDANCKIANLLPEIIALMAKHQQDYQRLAAEVDTDEVFALQNQQTIEEERKKQKYTAFSACLSSEEIIDDGLTFFESDKGEKSSEESKTRYLIDIWREGASRLQEKHLNRGVKEFRGQQFFRYQESKSKSLDMVNRILCILFNEWRNSEFFHELIKEELLISLNRKKPDIVDHLRIEYFRIIEKNKEETPILSLRAPPCEIYRCLFDFHLNFKGKIAVKICSKFKIGNKPDLEVKLMIREFQCPIRVCFTPFSIGKSYASLLDRPKLTIDYKVSVGKFELTKIPLFTQFIKTYAVIKLRKKFLWPKRFTLSLPLVFKSTLDLAIQQRINFEKEQERLSKKSK